MRHLRYRGSVTSLILAFSFFTACAHQPPDTLSNPSSSSVLRPPRSVAKCVERYSRAPIEHLCVSYSFGRHLWKDIVPGTGDVISVVVEIPQYTSAKWEVQVDTGELSLDFAKRRPRLGNFLVNYPVNYGMVPQTLTPESEGWDGDPLDILVIGAPAAYPGEILQARPIGVMHMIDKGERDDKLIGVRDDDPRLANIRNFADLLQIYKGYDGILRNWFTHYKYPHYRRKTIDVTRFSGRDEALKILAITKATFSRKP